MRKIVLFVIIFLILGTIITVFKLTQKNSEILSPLGKIVVKPFDKYTIENLQKRGGIPSKIDYVGENRFFFFTESKKVSGTVNLPKNIKNPPVIILIRGYADKELFYPGFGTEHVSEVLVKNGYATYAPDFLGFGVSASSSADAFEDRFLTQTTVLDLIATLNPAGIWAHSNGGQIALTVLEISGKSVPTALWNPVSITFPYSILYYTWDNDDHGKLLRKSLANFEKDYDTEKYSLTNYLDLIKAPILLQQGSADELVPPKWSDDLYEKLKKTNKNTQYIVYLGADHNMIPKWDAAVKDLLTFFRNQ